MAKKTQEIQASPMPTYDRAVTEAPFKIGVSMRQVTHWTWEFSWDVTHYHFGLTRNRLETVFSYIRQQSGNTITFASVDLKRGRITLTERKKYRMARTNLKRVPFGELPQGPQETAPALGRPDGMATVESYEVKAVVPEPAFGIKEAEIELTNLIYATCVDNPAADNGYFKLFSESETA